MLLWVTVQTSTPSHWLGLNKRGVVGNYLGLGRTRGAARGLYMLLHPHPLQMHPCLLPLWFLWIYCGIKHRFQTWLQEGRFTVETYTNIWLYSIHLTLFLVKVTPPWMKDVSNAQVTSWITSESKITSNQFSCFRANTLWIENKACCIMC